MSAKTYDSALDNPNAEKKGLAITAFIISLINLICCFTSASIILVPIVLILAIISIATHRGAKGLAIAAIIIGLIAAIIYGTIAVVFREPLQDISMFTSNAQFYIDDYEATHEVPEEFQKYNDPKYDDIWANSGVEGVDDFDSFYAYLIDTVKQSANQQASQTSFTYNDEESTELVPLFA